jgi:hypothetical protein
MEWTINRGCWDELVELAKTSRDRSDRPGRIYTSNIGSFNKLVMEVEFDSFAQLEEFWAAWWANSAFDEFRDRWFQLVDVDGHSEIWNLVE